MELLIYNISMLRRVVYAAVFVLIIFFGGAVENSFAQYDPNFVPIPDRYKNDPNLPADPALGNMPSQKDNKGNGFYKNDDIKLSHSAPSTVPIYTDTEKSEPLRVHPQNEEDTYAPTEAFGGGKEKSQEATDDLLNTITSNSNNENDDDFKNRLIAKNAAEKLLNRGNELISKGEKVENTDPGTQINNLRKEFWDYSESLKNAMDDETKIFYFDYENKIFEFVYEKLNDLEVKHKTLNEKKLDLYSEFLDNEKSICKWQKKDGYFDPNNGVFSREEILNEWLIAYGNSFTSNWQKKNFLKFANLLEGKF